MAGAAGKIGVAALGSTAGAAAAVDTAAATLLAGAIAGTSATCKGKLYNRSAQQHPMLVIV